MTGWSNIFLRQIHLYGSLEKHIATFIGCATVASFCGVVKANSKNDKYCQADNGPSFGLQPFDTKETSFDPASPTLPIRIIRPNPNLEIVYDVRTRNPIYVMEQLDKDSFRGGGHRRKRPNFYEDMNIEQEEYRSKLVHYRNSGYDRGHMAPAADFPNNPQDTFTLCNVSPQNHIMNVSIWNSLEEWIRRIVKSQPTNDTTIYVITGPLWIPNRRIDETKFEYRIIGLGKPPSLVSVPTHFFKVVVVVNKKSTKDNKILQHACFVLQNYDPMPSKNLEDYLVPWKDLETVTGLQLFPQWATEEWKTYADYMFHKQILSKRFGTNKQLPVGSSRLLLTDGSTPGIPNNNNRSSLWKRPKHSQFQDHEVQHLCTDGKCR